MSNTQVAALVQNLLMIGGSVAAATGKISGADVQAVIGGISAVLGFFWNHYSALTHPAPAK